MFLSHDICVTIRTEIRGPNLSSLTFRQYPTRVNHSIFSELFRVILFQNNVTVLNLTTDMLPFEPRPADPNLFSNYPVASDLVQPFERLELNWLIRPLTNNATVRDFRDRCFYSNLVPRIRISLL